VDNAITESACELGATLACAVAKLTGDISNLRGIDKEAEHIQGRTPFHCAALEGLYTSVIVTVLFKFKEYMQCLLYLHGRMSAGITVDHRQLEVASTSGASSPGTNQDVMDEIASLGVQMIETTFRWRHIATVKGDINHLRSDTREQVTKAKDTIAGGESGATPTK
jgi:hypothetical protein